MVLDALQQNQRAHLNHCVLSPGHWSHSSRDSQHWSSVDCSSESLETSILCLFVGPCFFISRRLIFGIVFWLLEKIPTWVLRQKLHKSSLYCRLLSLQKNDKLLWGFCFCFCNFWKTYLQAKSLILRKIIPEIIRTPEVICRKSSSVYFLVSKTDLTIKSL